MTLPSGTGKQVVIDASVALKWQFDDEECVSQALKLRDDFFLRGIVKVIAPRLIEYELANGIAVAVRRKRVPSEKAVEAMSNLIELGIEVRDVETLSFLTTALHYGITAYDAAYVALSRTEQCELWTGDKVLYRAVNSALPSVKWIGDYS